VSPSAAGVDLPVPASSHRLGTLCGPDRFFVRAGRSVRGTCAERGLPGHLELPDLSADGYSEWRVHVLCDGTQNAALVIEHRDAGKQGVLEFQSPYRVAIDRVMGYRVFMLCPLGGTSPEAGGRDQAET
jgi:hypothetical protein